MLYVWLGALSPVQAQYTPKYSRSGGRFVNPKRDSKSEFTTPLPSTPILQGATMGTIGPQPGPSADIIQGAMTSGIVKIPRKSNIELITICAFAASVLVIAVLTIFKKANLWLFGASFAVILVISGIAIGLDQLNDPSARVKAPMFWDVSGSCG